MRLDKFIHDYAASVAIPCLAVYAAVILFLVVTGCQNMNYNHMLIFGVVNNNMPSSSEKAYAARGTNDADQISGDVGRGAKGNIILGPVQNIAGKATSTSNSPTGTLSVPCSLAQ